MLKNIQELNNKMWYRLLKVIFLITFISSIIGYNYLLFAEQGLKNVNQRETKITCLHKDKKTYSPKDIGIRIDMRDIMDTGEFSYKNYFEGYNEYEIKAILEACYDREVDDIYVVQRLSELSEGSAFIPLIPLADKWIVGEIEKVKNAISFNKHKYLNYSFKYFDIRPVLTYSNFLLFFIIGNLIIIFIFELFRRIFYYILTGKIFPKQK